MNRSFQERLAEPMSAKRAILAVLAATGDQLSTAQLIQFGDVLGLESAAVRVALGRLVKNTDVATIARGVHTLGDKGIPMSAAFSRWRDLPRLMRPWCDDWICVYVAHLGRTRRALLRRRERALGLFGFAEHASGLWVRPDNLRLSSEELFEKLVALGLDDDAVVLSRSVFVGAGGSQAANLWDRRVLEADYTDARLAMGQCTAASDEMSLEELTRQTATIGAAVIEMLSFDPLLPEPLVDVTLREAVHTEMLAFDELGKSGLSRLWEQRR